MKQGVDLATESFGFKVMLTGTAGWVASKLAEMDWSQVIGILMAMVGIVIQIAAYRRNQAADKREREKHRMEMALLRRKLGKDVPDFEVSES